MSKMKKTRKPGGGRKKLKPEYDAGKNLKEQMDAAVALYNSEMSLQTIGEELGLNPIKIRKLLITAGVYESEVAEKVKNTFEEYRETQDYKTSILSTANTLKLSKASVTSYLPYEKGVYFPNIADKEKISVGAERQRRYRAVRKLRTEPTEEHLWEVVLLYAGVRFKTYSGLPFTYEIRKGRNAYAESVKYFREENDGKLPSLKSLKKRKEELTKEIAERKKAYAPLREESRRLEIASDNVYSIFRKTDEMKSDLAWKREWEANVREKARQEQVRQEQRVHQPKRKKRSYDMSL